MLVLTNHSNLTTFASKLIPNRRQARWANELSELNFKIVYRPGSENKQANALTRRSGDISTKEEQNPSKIFGPEKFQISSLEISFVNEIKKCQSLLPVISEGKSFARRI